MEKFMQRIKRFFQKEKNEIKILLRSIPATVVTLFVVSVICMNLLANKTLLQLEWIAIDGGILISWLSFMCMDMITKHFGPRASNRISVLASGINLLTCLIFFVASIIPSNAKDYSDFDGIFGGTWFVLLGSTVAFLASAVIYSLLNHTIGKCFHRLRIFLHPVTHHKESRLDIILCQDLQQSGCVAAGTIIKG